jgi:hypothetical protein
MAKPLAGILDLLNNGGSELSKYNGGTPDFIGSTVGSKLHGTQDGDFGYSTAGYYFDEVNQEWQLYNDGMNNPLPSPSELDKGTVSPTKYEDAFIASNN